MDANGNWLPGKNVKPTLDAWLLPSIGFSFLPLFFVHLSMHTPDTVCQEPQLHYQVYKVSITSGVVTKLCGFTIENVSVNEKISGN